MRLELRGHHVDVTPALRRLVEEKLSKLERLLNRRAVSVEATLSVQKHRHLADITLHASGERFLHGLGDAGSWETSVAQAITKISRQALRLKTQQKVKRHGLKAPADDGAEPVAPRATPRKSAAAGEPPAPRVRSLRTLRTTREAVRSMSIEDAARAIDNGGDGVVVFRSAESGAINVLYRRPNGDLTLVETEA
jgi:putative sigma-54 modulation protein